MIATLSWNSQWPPQACTQDHNIIQLMFPINICLASLRDVELSPSLKLNSFPSLQQATPSLGLKP